MPRKIGNIALSIILRQPQLGVMASIGRWFQLDQIVLACLLALVIVCPAESALAPEERQALVQVVNAFPDLTSVSPYDITGPDPNINPSWNTSFPSGWCRYAFGAEHCYEPDADKFGYLMLYVFPSSHQWKL